MKSPHTLDAMFGTYSVLIVVLLVISALATSCGKESDANLPIAEIRPGTPSRQTHILVSATSTRPTPGRTLAPTPEVAPTARIASLPKASPEETSTSVPTATPTSTGTPEPTVTPGSAETVTPTYWPTATRQILPEALAAKLVPCAERTLSDPLLEIVTQQFYLPDTFEPEELLSLADYFSTNVTLGLPTMVSASIAKPLVEIVTAMHQAGLQPSILSGYRSYSEQYLAWKWWNSQYPDRAAIMSARPGYSEHQLGTTVDFGSPSLKHLFHVDFADSPEGQWLAENAHLFGFTLSYPKGSQDITGFKYEPWHFRYVGVELATQLYTTGQTLTEWQLENHPPPCIP